MANMYIDTYMGFLLLYIYFPNNEVFGFPNEPLIGHYVFNISEQTLHIYKIYPSSYFSH